MSSRHREKNERIKMYDFPHNPTAFSLIRCYDQKVIQNKERTINLNTVELLPASNPNAYAFSNNLSTHFTNSHWFLWVRPTGVIYPGSGITLGVFRFHAHLQLRLFRLQELPWVYQAALDLVWTFAGYQLVPRQPASEASVIDIFNRFGQANDEKISFHIENFDNSSCYFTVCMLIFQNNFCISSSSNSYRYKRIVYCFYNNGYKNDDGKCLPSINRYACPQFGHFICYLANFKNVY